MTEANEPLESIEGPEEITDAEISDFIDRGGEAPTYHPILQVWREVLAPAAAQAGEQVTPQWANRIVQSYPEVRYADMEVYRDSYFAKIAELVAILDAEIATLDEPFEAFGSPQLDVEHNSYHYKNLLLCWQMAVLQWELDWRCTDQYAAVELAAISEVHKMFFGQTGLTQFLDNIKLEFTEADQQMLGEALEAMKEGR